MEGIVILRKQVWLASLVMLFLSLAPSAMCAGAGGQFRQENRPENLKALFETIYHLIYVKKDTKSALALLVSLYPNEERIKKALKNDTPLDTLQKILDMHKQRGLPTELDVKQLAKPEQKSVRVHGATTEEIAKYAEGSVAFKQFPGGARRIAAQLFRPGLTFYEVEFVEPGQEHGMTYHLFYWDGQQWTMLGPIWRALQ